MSFHRLISSPQLILSNMRVRWIIPLSLFLAIVIPSAIGRIEIINVHTITEGTYLNITAQVHENRTMFDVTFDVHRELKAHDLILNIRLKMKSKGSQFYRLLYARSRIDLCQFLARYQEDTMMRYFFRFSTNSSSPILCPIRRGHYELRNFALYQRMPSGVMVNGRYKFFVELAQCSADDVKLLSLQVTTQYTEDAT